MAKDDHLSSLIVPKLVRQLQYCFCVSKMNPSLVICKPRVWLCNLLHGLELSVHGDRRTVDSGVDSLAAIVVKLFSPV